MAILTAADIEAIVDSGIDTATIETAIAREEATLARALGGPLEGERTDTLYPAGHDGPLTLRRFASGRVVDASWMVGRRDLQRPALVVIPSVDVTLGQGEAAEEAPHELAHGNGC